MYYRCIRFNTNQKRFKLETKLNRSKELSVLWSGALEQNLGSDWSPKANTFGFQVSPIHTPLGNFHFVVPLMIESYVVAFGYDSPCCRLRWGYGST
jgi:hypothetical protein